MATARKTPAKAVEAAVEDPAPGSPKRTEFAEWLADLGAACDELGYGIVSFEQGRIILAPVKGRQIRVTLEAVYLNGQLLREALLPAQPYRSRDEE